jgi:hypothetical protein
MLQSDFGERNEGLAILGYPKDDREDEGEE